MADNNILTNLEIPVSPLEKYVGEGKKFASVEDLAKAYEHADKHIEKMNNDNSHLREEFEAFRELATEQLTKRIESNNSNRDTLNPDLNDKNQRPEPASSVPPKINEDDLNARIAQIVEEKDEEKRLSKNADLAQEVMIKRFGGKEEAQEAIRKRAEELGVSPTWLASSAFQSPRAFFTTMGIDPDEGPRSTYTPASKSDVNTSRLTEMNSGIKPGTYAYYQEIRRKDPGRYFSQEIQNSIMRDAIQAANEGRDFYKN